MSHTEGLGSMLSNEGLQRMVGAMAVKLLPVKKKLRIPYSFETWLVLNSLVQRRVNSIHVYSSVATQSNYWQILHPVPQFAVSGFLVLLRSPRPA